MAIDSSLTKTVWLFMTLLGFLMALTSLTTDIYLPAIPVMQCDLQGNVELTITGFMIGFALTQLVWGPVRDCIGHRKTLLIGVALFVPGSAGCALSTTPPDMFIWQCLGLLAPARGRCLPGRPGA